MPFQIQNNTAYRELVLDVLRQQAATPGTDTYELLQNNPGYNSYGDLRYDEAIHGNLERAQGCYDTHEKVLWYCYRYMPLHFNAFQRMMQIEEEQVANLQYGDTFRKKVFNTKW